jgi:hypothetical protein
MLASNFICAEGVQNNAFFIRRVGGLLKGAGFGIDPVAVGSRLAASN